MPTVPFSKQIVLWGDSRITANITEAEAFHTWAENEGISRQGVRDVIVRAEAAMQEIEDKTGLIRRFEQFRGHLDAIRSAAEDIRTLNYRQYEDSRLTELADKITAEVSALKE